TLAENDHRSGAWFAVLGIKHSAGDELNLEDREQLRSSNAGVHDERLAGSRQSKLMRLHRSEIAEHIGLSPHILKVGVRPAIVQAILRLLKHVVELFGVWIRQRLQQRGIYDAEDRGVCAHTECEREHRHRGETRILPQHAQCKAEILPERFEN